MHFSSDALFKELRPAFHAKRYIVALSGGLDSMVLLHALLQLPVSQKIIALHINHQLSDNCLKWEQFCRAECEKLNVDFFSRVTDVKPNGSGLEEAAREARYREFSEFLESGDCLITAHHLNDQAETFLLRLMRGSGTRGLSGMPLTRQVGDGYVYRPLLNYPRHELEVYAQEHNINWVEDESNEDEDLDRNFMRKNVLEPLKRRWPSMLKSITRSAKLSSEAEELSRELAAIDLFACYPRDDRWGVSITLPYLKGSSHVRQKNAVRFWIEEKELELPGQARLEEIVSNVIHAGEGTKPMVEWDGVQCRRFGERLYLINKPVAFDAKAEYELNPGGEYINIPGVGELSLATDLGVGLKIKSGDKITVKFRQGGERCKPEGRRHSQTLKKLFQECEIPPWVRDRTPLIFINGEFAAVGDFWINEGYSVLGDEHETGYVVGCYYDLAMSES